MNCTVLLEQMQLSDLNENHRELAEVIGLNNFLKLLKEFGGRTINIPTISTVTRGFVYACILKEYDGVNLNHLAKKYNVSRRTIYRLLRNEIQI